MTLTRETVLQALARGYCAPGNTHKELDSKLLYAMADEVMALASLSAEAEAVAWVVNFLRESGDSDRLIVWRRERAEQEVEPALITSITPLYARPQGQGWIACSEKRPEVDEDVLLYWHEVDDYKIGYWDGHDDWHWWEGAGTVTADAEPTHWQPITPPGAAHE